MHARTRTGRAVLRGAGLVLAVLAITLALTASSATGASQSSKQEAFRHQFDAYLIQLQRVATTYQSTPQGRAAYARLGYRPSAIVSKARSSVRRMSPQQLAILQRSLSAAPMWRAIPGRLESIVNRLAARTSHRSFLITPDDCATNRAAGITQTDVEIAADVALAADAVLEAVPQDLLSEVVRIAAVAIWAIPQGTLRGFEHQYNIASACDDADHQALVQQNLDVKVSTRATQASLDSLTTNFNALSTLVNSRLDVAVSTRATQTSLDSLSSLVNSRLDVAVSTRATQASLTAFNNEFTANATVVNNKLDSITSSVGDANQKLDALTITVNDQGALDLRLKIEEDLATPGNHALALFEVPASAGGYLGLTRDIVADTIAKMQATGQGVGNAQSFLASGDSAVAAHDYKSAYADYGKAYRAAAG
jgi:flagellar basal body-associated protein FliL